MSDANAFAATTLTPKRGFANALFGHTLGLLFCVGMPALVTAVAPVSWIRFERADGRVTATAKTCLLFFVPYRTRIVDPVIGVGDRFVKGKPQPRRAGEPQRYSEDEAFLVIDGESSAAEVPVTPFNIKRVAERSEAFMQDDTAATLEMFVVANWKFSVLMGGGASLLTVLYAVGACWSFARMLKRIALPSAV